MVGPVGVGENRYVKPGEWMDYTIYFENKSAATAAAQDVYVTLPKDVGLDWTTFELGEVVFGENIDTALSGVFDGTSTYAIPGTNWSVRTIVEHTSDTVKWHLRIVDPTTPDNYPMDAYAGFLPPNDATGRGEGHLRYRVKVKDDATPGNKITASATIVFDYNDPIETDPAWWNTVAEMTTVSFESGTTEFDNVSLIVGMPYGELPEPVKTGWTFGGWYTEPNGKGRHVTAQSLVESGDSALYEHWLANAYTVRFNANGGEGVMSNQAFEFDKEMALAANAFAMAGHSFAGWATNETCEAEYADCQVVSNLTAVSGAEVDLYATWGVNSYSVTFDYGYGGRLDSATQEYGTAIVVPDDVVREGYTFAGWQPAVPATVPAEDVTFVAQWEEIIEYATIVMTIGGVETNVVLVVGKPYGELPEPVKTGWTFGGWYTEPNGNGRRVTAQSLVESGDSALYEYWLANAYSVRFNANGGEGVMSSQAFRFDEKKALDKNVFEEKGCSFIGWATDSDGAVVYEDSQEVVNLASDDGAVVDLYAVWSVNSYTVWFDANDGSLKSSPRKVVKCGEAMGHLPTPTRDGYDFVGWFTAVDGGDEVGAQTVVTANMTIYAHWKERLPDLWPDDDGTIGGSDDAADEDAHPPMGAASVYDGFIGTAGGELRGTIQVKVAKPKANKKTGETTAKVTASILLMGEKKVSVKGEMDAAGGEFSGTAKDGRALSLTLTAERMSGSFGGFVVDGSRNAFVSKDKGEQADANAVLAQWIGPVNVAWETADGWNGMTVTIANKGKAKAAGTLADGTKLSATAQVVQGLEWSAVPVVITKKAALALTLWLSNGGQVSGAKGQGGVVVTGLGDGAIAGKPGTLASGSEFVMDVDAFADMVGDDTFADYLPNGVAVTQNGAKWSVPKGGKVAYKKGTTEVDEAKAGGNPSALKLTYTAKTGAFKGSFKAYVDAGGKPKALAAKIVGVMVRGIAYGAATIKKLGSIGVEVR